MNKEQEAWKKTSAELQRAERVGKFSVAVSPIMLNDEFPGMGTKSPKSIFPFLDIPVTRQVS